MTNRWYMLCLQTVVKLPFLLYVGAPRLTATFAHCKASIAASYLIRTHRATVKALLNAVNRIVLTKTRDA